MLNGWKLWGINNRMDKCTCSTFHEDEYLILWRIEARKIQLKYLVQESKPWWNAKPTAKVSLLLPQFFTLQPDFIIYVIFKSVVLLFFSGAISYAVLQHGQRVKSGAMHFRTLQLLLCSLLGVRGDIRDLTVVFTFTYSQSLVWFNVCCTS